MELRLIRTLDRIEHLKDNGRWSFRQPKKQRGVGGLTKTHWDYLMDEMVCICSCKFAFPTDCLFEQKWMRIDFREERKWKMVLAYNLATAVLEWHAAGSLVERVERGICVLWKRPRTDNMDVNNAEEDASGMDFDSTPIGDSQSNPLSMIDYGSDDDEEQDKDQQSVVDALETTAMVEDALDDSEVAIVAENAPSGDTELPDMEPKVEDVGGIPPLQIDAADRGSDAMEVDGSDRSTHSEKEKMEESVAPTLKPSSVDPILSSNDSSLPITVEGETSGSFSSLKSTVKPNVYAPLRERIAYSDDTKLFLDLDDFVLTQSFSELTANDTSHEDPPPAPDLSSIFPDMQPLALLDVAMPIVTSTKRSDRRSKQEGRAHYIFQANTHGTFHAL
jgi:chromatin modification-related protein VID21